MSFLPCSCTQLDVVVHTTHLSLLCQFIYHAVLLTMQLVYLLVYLCCLHNELSYMRPHYCCVICQ